MVKLQSSDGETFDAQDIAEFSVTIKNMLDNMDDDTEDDVAIPVDITKNILSKVVEYIKHLKENPPPTDTENPKMSAWEEGFCNTEQSVLFQLMLAANFLDIKPLLHLIAKTIANMMRGKTSEEIRKHFNIENDLTPEEEEQIRKENAW